MTEADLYPAVFLDRDGTLNRDKGYVHLWADWEWLPGAPEALARLKGAGYKLVVVSNQAGVAKGYYSEEAVLELHRRVNLDLAGRGLPGLDAFHHCPHHPDYGGPCSCRKPAPRLIRLAAAEQGLDMARSFMVGDKLSDAAAGLAAGCRPILVLTGHGRAEAAAAPPDIPVAEDLAGAARLILNVNANFPS
ncbi:MAG: HAD family hydrolase [Candidatus Adiutrix sp.]|jgi:D-glycero-D-manno-heptose 1,7-bisphosphate phosphatase|nr:HAD family hydrolase [Candidatus Adiutrix sp.]